MVKPTFIGSIAGGFFRYTGSLKTSLFSITSACVHFTVTLAPQLPQV